MATLLKKGEVCSLPSSFILNSAIPHFLQCRDRLQIPVAIRTTSFYAIDGSEVRPHRTSARSSGRSSGLTKGDLLQYYADVAAVLLPHIRNRAMVMKRYPHGAIRRVLLHEACAVAAPRLD